MTNDNGQIVQKFYYDAWGKQVLLPKHTWTWLAQASAAPALANVLDITPRDFTGYEHVNHADIIHMNGRIYDPTLGRFLQADPFIQTTKHSQSYNRYSYGMNNPLSGSDPSGYIFGFLKNTWKKIKQYAGVIAGILFAAYCQVCSANWINAALTGAAIGGGSVAINGGNILKGALIGAFSGAAFQQIGEYFKNLSSYNKTFNWLVTEEAFQIKTHTLEGLA